MFKKLKKKAFTLVELLVVIAILAILASVSVVGYLGFTENARKSKAVTELTQYKTMLLGELASGSATLDNGTEDVATDDVTLTMIEQGKIEVAKKGDTDVKVVLNKFFGARDNSINVKYDTNDTNLIIYIDYTTDDNATASWNISTDEVVAGASTGGSETDPSEPTDPEEPEELVEFASINWDDSSFGESFGNGYANDNMSYTTNDTIIEVSKESASLQNSISSDSSVGKVLVLAYRCKTQGVSEEETYLAFSLNKNFKKFSFDLRIWPKDSADADSFGDLIIQVKENDEWVDKRHIDINEFNEEKWSNFVIDNFNSNEIRLYGLKKNFVNENGCRIAVENIKFYN